MENHTHPMTHGCTHPTSELEDYLLGHITPERSQTIEEHLIVCQACRDELEEAGLFIEDMRAALTLCEADSAVAGREARPPTEPDRREATRTGCDTPVVVSCRTDSGVSGFPGRYATVPVPPGCYFGSRFPASPTGQPCTTFFTASSLVPSPTSTASSDSLRSINGWRPRTAGRPSSSAREICQANRARALRKVSISPWPSITAWRSMVRTGHLSIPRYAGCIRSRQPIGIFAPSKTWNRGCTASRVSRRASCRNEWAGCRKIGSAATKRVSRTYANSSCAADHASPTLFWPASGLVRSGFLRGPTGQRTARRGCWHFPTPWRQASRLERNARESPTIIPAGYSPLAWAYGVRPMQLCPLHAEGACVWPQIDCSARTR